MTSTPIEAETPISDDAAATGVAAAAAATAVAAPGPVEPSQKPLRAQAVQPVLEKLFELYPHLFGAEFLPLKLGIFQELLAANPDVFARDTLKAALGVHTRSARYLQCVAARKPRHDLQGAPVEDVAPEHVYLAIAELFRRRQGRSSEDLRPKLRAQLMVAFEASGLTSQAYLAKIPSGDTDTAAVLQEALADHGQKLARQEALARAFEASGKSLPEFADMYGLRERDVKQALATHHLAGNS